MRLITHIFFLSILLYMASFGQSNPVVSNVTFAQRTDGSLKVDVYYDVYDADGDTLYVTLQASSDNGATWALPVSYVTGDVGGNILSGTNKQIVWEFGREKPNFFSDQVKIKVTATDIKCNGLLVDYGGKVYTTVQIGQQCWLKENLDIGVMIAGNQNQSNNLVIEKYCYDNNPANCNTYGGLYQLNEAMQYVMTSGAKGICPAGWHIPTLEEFQALVLIVDGNSNSLKAIGQGSGSGAGTNLSGFSAVLSGYRVMNGIFSSINSDAYFFTSPEFNTTFAYYMILEGNSSTISFLNYNSETGFSIRCMKD